MCLYALPFCNFRLGVGVVLGWKDMDEVRKELSRD